MGTAEHTADRTRDEIIGGLLRRRLALDDAAVRLHDEKTRGRPSIAEAVAEVVEVAGEHRLQICIGNSSVAAVVLAPARIDLVRKRYRDAWNGGAELPRDFYLVLRV